MSVSELPMKSLSSKCQAAMMERADPVADYWAAFQSHNRGELDGDSYIAKLETLDNWEPPTCRDYVRKIHARLTDGGCPPEEIAGQFVHQAAKLLECAEAAPPCPRQPADIIDRIKDLCGFLDYMLATANYQLSDITCGDYQVQHMRELADSCMATVIVAMEFQEQIADEVEKLRRSLESQPIAA